MPVVSLGDPECALERPGTRCGIVGVVGPGEPEECDEDGRKEERADGDDIVAETQSDRLRLAEPISQRRTKRTGEHVRGPEGGDGIEMEILPAHAWHDHEACVEHDGAGESQSEEECAPVALNRPGSDRDLVQATSATEATLSR